mgnify:FL=1
MVALDMSEEGYQGVGTKPPLIKQRALLIASCPRVWCGGYRPNPEKRTPPTRAIVDVRRLVNLASQVQRFTFFSIVSIAL